MKTAIEACLAGAILILAAGAQESHKPALTKGIRVQMPIASHAVEMRAADEPNATVVAIAADGKVFVGVEATEPEALSKLSDGTIYVKADSRVAYERVLTVLDALRGKTVVLLCAPPANAAARRGTVSPYGIVIESR